MAVACGGDMGAGGVDGIAAVGAFAVGAFAVGGDASCDGGAGSGLFGIEGRSCFLAAMTFPYP